MIGKDLGRYHILEQLGEGGMATVYKAFDMRLECDVAVKLISTSKFTQEAVGRALKRFDREAKALARLTHPNIVKVTDYGEYEGQPYLVMPFLAGGNLKQYLKEHGRLQWQDAAHLLLPIAQALEFAHSQGVIHRDVKPANILLTQNGQPMLTDFGVAKVVEEEATSELTGTAAAMGTPEYMAPEQTGKNIDQRVDIYALGIVFYEMLTGRRPYEADTPLAVLVKQASEPLPRPSQFVPGLPDAVEKVLLKALAKKPAERYQGMGEFAAATERLMGMRGQGEGGRGAWDRGAGEIVAPGIAASHTMDGDDSSRTFVQAGCLASRLQEPKRDNVLPMPVEQASSPFYQNMSATPPDHQKTASHRPAWLPWEIGAGVLFLIAMVVLWNLSRHGSLAPPTAAPATAAPAQTSSPLKRPVDGMVMLNVPAGSFTMGYTLDQAMAECQKYESDCQQSWYTDEQPVHTVLLDA